MHFRWLSTVYDWKNASAEFREAHYILYVIRVFWLLKKYQDTPGFMRCGKGPQGFYSTGGMQITLAIVLSFVGVHWAHIQISLMVGLSLRIRIKRMSLLDLS